MTITVLVWTPSGSCPLCLTPPCYQLSKPPVSGGSFFVPALRRALSRIRTAFIACHRWVLTVGNHINGSRWTLPCPRAMICSS